MPQHIGQKTPMHKSKTLQEREKELQPLMATPAGRDQLHELASRYQASSGKLKPAKTSVITYILIHERKQGMICL